MRLLYLRSIIVCYAIDHGGRKTDGWVEVVAELLTRSGMV
jgi:hypothetical protein